MMLPWCCKYPSVVDNTYYFVFEFLNSRERFMLIKKLAQWHFMFYLLVMVYVLVIFSLQYVTVNL